MKFVVTRYGKTIHIMGNEKNKTLCGRSIVGTTKPRDNDTRDTCLVCNNVLRMILS